MCVRQFDQRNLVKHIQNRVMEVAFHIFRYNFASSCLILIL
jgi:hypothetical protein